MNRYNKTRTFTDSDSCHTPVSATANYRKAYSSNNNDLIVLTLTSNKSIAYKEYFPKKEATCTEAGYESYWMCGSDADSNKCRKIFSDEDCTRELAAPIAIPRRDTISLQVPITRNCLAPVPISVIWNTGIAASATSILPITPA